MKRFLLIVALMALSRFVVAQQEGMMGEIKIFAGNFPPKGWMFCQGQILPISQNTALFSILGTTYGGNGVTTFALPNLTGRVAIQQGQVWSGGTYYALGEMSGTETNTLTQAQMPVHTHGVVVTVPASKDEGTSDDPTGKYLAVSGTNAYSNTSDVTLAPVSATTNPVGASQPVNNMQPYLGINYIICVQGFYPVRD